MTKRFWQGLLFLGSLVFLVLGCEAPTEDPKPVTLNTSIQITNYAEVQGITVQATLNGQTTVAKSLGAGNFRLENLSEGDYTLEALGTLADGETYFLGKTSFAAGKTRQIVLPLIQKRTRPGVFMTPSENPLSSGDKVQVTWPDADGTLFYTLDGSEPTAASSQYPQGGIPLTQTSEVKVRVIASGLLDSPVRSKVYSIDNNVTPLPVITPASGTYQTLEVTIQGSGTIRYTTDGTDPTNTSAIYSQKFSLPARTEPYTVKATAQAPGKAVSGTAMAQYTVTGIPVQTQTPALSPGEGIFTSQVKVTVSGEASSVFYYTADGTVPSETSTPYPALGLTITKNTTIKVVAKAPGKLLSEVTTAYYQITDLPVTKAPVLSLTTGTYQGVQTLTLTQETGAKTYISLDGSTPAATAQNEYTGPITLNQEKTYNIVAFSTKAGQKDSPEASALVTVVINVSEYKLYFYHPVAGEIPEAYVWYTTAGGTIATPFGAWATTEKMVSWTHAGWYVVDLKAKGVPLNQTVGIIFKIASKKLSSDVDQSRNKTGWLHMEGTTPVWSDDDPFKPAPPVISVDKAAGNYPADVVLTATVTERNSPVTEKTYALNGGNPQSLPADGKITLALGALSEGQSISIQITTKSGAGDTVWGPFSYTKKTDVIVKDHRNLRLYQVMVEAYQDGSSAGFGTGYGPSFHNGDLQGVIKALDYIKSTGVNGIWLTPIFDSWTGDTKGQASGYYADDYFKIEPSFGGEADFVELVKQAHLKGLYVILDGVFGHHGADALAPSPKGNRVSDNGSQWYGKLVDYNQSGSVEYFKEVATYWIEKYGIDGWRLDQAYQVPIWAWKQIREAVTAASDRRLNAGETWGTLGYMVGEILSGDPVVVKNQAYGTDANPGLHSAFDFPIRYKLIQVLATQEHNNDAGAQGQPAPHLKAGLDERSTYPSFALPNLFLSNHDMVRFGDLLQRSNLGLGPDSPDYWKRHKAAWLFMSAVSGPMTMYYGDEYGDEVSNFVKEGDRGLYDDHASRSDGKISGFNANQDDLRAFTRGLFTLRDQHPALWKGSRTNLLADTTRIAELKTEGADKVLMVLNVGTVGTTFSFTSGQLGGSTLKDLQTGETLTPGSISVGGLSGRLLQVSP